MPVCNTDQCLLVVIHLIQRLLAALPEDARNNWARNLVLVRQRFHGGDLDAPKTRKALRDVPLGQLAERLRANRPGPGHDDEFIFSKTAKALGLYWKGFGFHTFRREAIAAISGVAGVGKAMNAAGHFRKTSANY